MSEHVILTEIVDRVGVIRLNRPEALNALNLAILNTVVEAAEAFQSDPNIMALVITGNDKAFAAGADIKEMADKSYIEMHQSDWFSQWTRFTDIRLPIVAAVNGFALGGGCELAMMADLIIAGPNTKFGQPEINLGVIPGMGGSQRLTRAVGKSKAMDMVLTGRMMDGEEAERAGLVARLVEDDKVFDTAMEVAQTIASKSRPVVMAAKEAVDTAFETSLTQGLLFERRAFHALFALEDQKEGMDAFSNKRRAQFQDR
ncbi:enoyl-CoA hydratase-related protein [Enteractinococcus coprophilus]|uniref:Probable enoyl-CoA hydratase echA8 n=1 Tax=Enteractinococcus coprophilus TaxID=1027633 RepID=A0A543AF41_9MICC|nr:enoyl-CoA hydratase-related protein [Enteractinococcus coprophilus]TQL71195.1 short chain enoyl-CoA hydratase [Enteractinococcus coprophilus]